MKTFIFALLFVVSAGAQDEPLNPASDVPTGYVKKIAVFPIEGTRSKAADNAWWKVREQLTDTKRFWVASKRFLVQKDVFQPRSKLQPSDAILLGQLLDSDALMLMSLKGRDLHTSVYSRFDGSILWTSQLQFHPSLPVDEQLTDVAVKLTRDFIAKVPYQGFQILDPLINKPVFEEGDVKLAKVDVGGNTRIVEGDLIQWVVVERTTGAPLFVGGARLDVIAEGQVAKNDNGILLVEIKRAKDIDLLKKDSLVRAPKEVEHLNINYALQSNRALAPELRYTPLPPARSEHEETKPLLSALVGIANAALFLLLAF